MGKRLSIILLIALSVSVLFSCGSGPDFLKSTGEIVHVEVDVDVFNTISAVDEVDIYIYQGVEQKVVIRAGKNLIDKIHLTVADEILTITNKNAFNWVRKKGNPEIHITAPELKRIEVFDFTNVYGIDTLYVSDFEIYSLGTGDITLLLNAGSVNIRSDFISVIDVKGETEYLRVASTKDSKFLLSELKANEVSVGHYGSNRIDVFPVHILRGTIRETGDLFYYNEPEILEVNVYGSGQLISVNP